MNILKKYCLKINNFSYMDMKKIISYSHDDYTLIRKAPQFFFIKSKKNDKIEPLKCISQCFTINNNGKPVKIPKVNGQCHNTKLKFGISAPDCDRCYGKAFELFDKNEIYMAKNGK